MVATLSQPQCVKPGAYNPVAHGPEYVKKIKSPTWLLGPLLLIEINSIELMAWISNYIHVLNNGKWLLIHAPTSQMV